MGQTPGAPLLFVARSGGSALISWSTNNAAGFVLEVTGSPTTPISWSNAPQSPVQSNGTNTVTVPMVGGPQFYRLHKP